MPIITKNQAKVLLQIPTDDVSLDDIINKLILPVQEFIYNYTNNPFILPDIWAQGSLISFHKKYTVIDPDTGQSKDYTYAIVDEDSQRDFTINSQQPGNCFQSSMDLYVENSRLNNGIFFIKTVDPKIITLSMLDGQEEQFWDEPHFRFIVLTAVKFPKALQFTAAKMIGHQLNKDFRAGKTSVHVGEWSESYNSKGDYPASLLRELNNYRRLF